MPSVINNVGITKPYVVILGAGASKQAFPNGDRTGKLVPLMNELFRIKSINEIIKKYKLPQYENFEEFYNHIHHDKRYDSAIFDLEKVLHQYFSSLQLPDEPTLYDYLLLSLRETDVIATFNWDPFIVQAHNRVRRITAKLPTILFLHGTVALGRCIEHFIVDRVGNICRECGKGLSQLQLLYPIAKKDYEGQSIEEQWQILQEYLKQCNGMTIFGYDAPVSDARAIDLLKKAWGSPDERIMEDIDIINKKSREELKDSWRDFIHQDHYVVFENYFDSSIANYPRRVNEYHLMRFHGNMWVDSHKIPPGLTFEELKREFLKIIEFEKS